MRLWSARRVERCGRCFCDGDVVAGIEGMLIDCVVGAVGVCWFLSKVEASMI